METAFHSKIFCQYLTTLVFMRFTIIIILPTGRIDTTVSDIWIKQA